ncbi:MAG: hypothetical protein V1706_00935 [Pseudomonadota bacterium]
MVITDEFKFPRPPRIDTGESRLIIREIGGLSPVLPINQYRKKWRRGENRPFVEGVEEDLTDEAEKDLQLLVSQVNQNLEKAGIAIHLGLVREDGGYALDIYDCTSGFVCQIVREEAIHIKDLPNMLKNLQQEAGILIDIKV